MSKVSCTTDYTQFYRPEGQRNPQPTDPDVIRLVASMRKHGFIPSQPITVHSDGAVVDGLHRLVAAQVVGCAVYYIVNNEMTMPVVRDISGTVTRWTNADYINSNAADGNEHYQWLKEFAEREQLGTQCLLAAIRSKNTAALRTGDMVIDQQARQFLIRLAAILKDFAGCLPTHFRSRQFCAAITCILHTPGYDHNQMMQRLSYQSDKLQPQVDKNSYLRVLQEVYNYRTPPAKRLYWAKR